MTASGIMTKPVHTVTEDCSLEEAAHLMLRRGIGCLPVTDADGKLTGILTESDFAAKEKGVPFSLYRFPQVFGDWMPERGVEAMYTAARKYKVGRFMSRAIAKVQADDSLETVLKTMLRTRFHRLPVVSGDVPVGIITRHDLLRLMVSGGWAPAPQDGQK